MIAGSLDYAGAALLVCRAAGRAGAGLVTLAVPESLQPLFAAKVVEATTMALPEDDVEEVDPEPALAKILDHEHDALVIGPGLRPSLASGGPAAAPAHGRPRRPGPPVGARRGGAADARRRRRVVGRGSRGRACSRPTRASSPGCGPAAATSRPRTATSRRTTTRGRRPRPRPPAEWRQVVVLKGARTVIAAPDGTVAIAPFENPAMASGGTGDVLAGTIGALLAQGLAPFDAARLGVYLHGLAGELVRERIGDAGLLAGDLPDALPDRSQAPRRDRRARSDGPARSGFGAREGRRGRRRRREPATAGDASTLARAARPRAREPIEARLARAGLPPLPRTAWLEIDLDALRGNLAVLRASSGPTCGSSPSSRRTPTATGRCRSPAPSRRRAPTGCPSRRSTRRSSSATRGVALPVLVLYPIPPEHAAAAAAARIAVSVGGGRADAASCAAAAARPRPGRPDLDVHVEVETGLGRGGVLADEAAAADRARSSRRRASGSPASGPISPPPTTCPARARQDARFDAALGAPRGRGRARPDADVRRHLAGSGGVLGGRARTLGRRPSRPRHLRARPRRARRRPRRPPRPPPPCGRSMALLRAPGARRRPAGGPRRVSYGPTFVTSRPSRIATLPRRVRRRLAARPLGPGVRARARRPGAARRVAWRWTP